MAVSVSRLTTGMADVIDRQRVTSKAKTATRGKVRVMVVVCMCVFFGRGCFVNGWDELRTRK